MRRLLSATTPAGAFVAVAAGLIIASCRGRPLVIEPKPAAGTYQLDGVYTFRIDYREGTLAVLRTTGSFVIADSQVMLSQPPCAEAEAPRASEGMEEAWFDCARQSRTGVQLRINRTDPINKSRWYGRLLVSEPARACRRYAANGNCTQVVNTRIYKYVERSGRIDVTRGIPVPPDGSGTPGKDLPKRAGCDTVRTGWCSPARGDHQR
ncbi:MAG TPA: hypothetical protein VF981_13800 [Gemmatimonadaceae bacterium]